MTLDEFLLSRVPSGSNGRAAWVPKAVVLAGGRGTRLAPYTSILPKPLMPIGNSSILEIVLHQLSACGVSEVTLCVGYLSHLIEAVLSHGSSCGVKLTYVREEEALGTAGPLRLIGDLDETFMMMNGDVLTTLDFSDLVRHHREEGNLVTIATHERAIKIDYGVLELGKRGDTNRVYRYVEKPEVTSTVSMGIYVLEPEALEYIPTGCHFDFPDLVHQLLRAKQDVGVYKSDAMWFDIGRPDDYRQAAAAWSEAADALVEAHQLSEAVVMA